LESFSRRVTANKKNKRLLQGIIPDSLDIRKLHINNFKKHTDAPNKKRVDLLEIGSSTVTNVLSGRY